MVIACAGNAYAQKVLIFVNRFNNGCQKQQETVVFIRLCPRVEQVFAFNRAQRPVVMFAAAVYAVKRFFVQQAHQIMFACHALHQFHGKLVMIGCNVGACKNRRQLVLGRCNLIMLGFGKHAQLPQLFVKLFHKRLNAWFDNAEIMVLKLLPFRRHCAEQRTAGEL